MNSPEKTRGRKLETFEHAEKRHLHMVTPFAKSKATARTLARALARADWQRGLVAAPVETLPQERLGR
jgi:hypothetical protein